MPYKDPEIDAEYHRQYKLRNRWKWRNRQRATDSARHANQRAAELGVPGTITIDEAQAILDPGLCHYCHQPPTLWLGLDHVIPLVAGGTNRPENIVAACHSCNSSKHQSDRPHRWSRLYDCCIDCGTTERKHTCHGRCARCYARTR